MTDQNYPEPPNYIKSEDVSIRQLIEDRKNHGEYIRTLLSRDNERVFSEIKPWLSGERQGFNKKDGRRVVLEALLEEDEKEGGHLEHGYKDRFGIKEKELWDALVQSLTELGFKFLRGKWVGVGEDVILVHEDKSEDTEVKVAA